MASSPGGLPGSGEEGAGGGKGRGRSAPALAGKGKGKLLDPRGRQDARGLQDWSEPERVPGFGPVAASRALGLAPVRGERLGAEELASLIREADARLEVCNGRRFARVSVAGRELELEPLAPCLGTVVRGLDLAGPLDAETVGFLRRLWFERRAIFFRDQGHLTKDQLAAFAAHFGEIGGPYGEKRGEAKHVPRPAGVRVEDVSDVLTLQSDHSRPLAADAWHSDASWSDRPPMGSALFCRTCPPIGGDTLFCDAYAMFEGLPAETKAKLKTIRCLHQGHNQHLMDGLPPQSSHPALRTHPETGGTTLYVSPHFTRLCEGLAEEESSALLAQCFAACGRPEYTCRFQWDAGSLAIWDNRACQHYACGDYWPHARHMERVCFIDPVERLRAPFFSEPAPRARL